MPSRNSLKRAWDNLISVFNSKVSEQSEEIERAMGFARLREQLWEALDNSEESAAGWAYPIDIFVGDDGSSLFSIVTQGGKLYQVPMTVADDNVSLGSWTQVTEVFEPVNQSKARQFTITRDKKTGKHRWLFIAATSVINRVGEIDSTELFDSFVEDAEETGDFPRVDFYHLGESDPEKWEFGTADYLARDGFCYIATGTFDDHPLARAAIKAYEEQPGVWGCSIEFYAKREAEVIVLDPKVQVPVYKTGKNTRISIVKEVDAAGLFTRVADIVEEKVRMKRDIMAVLEEFFGDDTTALETFAEDVDNINRTVKAEGLISRAKAAKRDPNPKDDEEEDADGEDTEADKDGEETEDDNEDAPIELDDEAIAQVAKQVIASPEFAKIQQTLDKISAAQDILVQSREQDAKGLATLKKDNATLAKRLAEVEKGDTEKKQTWAEDLPARNSRRATYVPREQNAGSEEEDGSDLEAVAKRTLSKLPTY